MLPHYLAKQAIDDKLQGSVATYLRYGGVVDKQIKKGLLLSLPADFFTSVNIWQSYKQEHGCLVHFVCLQATIYTAKRRRKCTAQSTFFVRNYAKYSPILKIVLLTDSAIDLS